ncbi:rod shape-determining protein RodA [Candidatus Sumerlaeota bacterium]|nr:rod shape-determining protein RodA [Candidatus Sumerlaeota bacterium]
MISFEPRFWRQIDWLVVGSTAALTAFGILIIYGTTYDPEARSSYPIRQLMWWIVSAGAFVVVLFMNYGLLARLALPIYLGCLALLAGLLAGAGLRAGGAASWYDLGPLGVRFQPSEITKIAVILLVAAYLARIKERLPGWRDLACVSVLALVPALLIALQPDAGTAATFLPLIVVMPWAAGARRRIYIVLAAIVLVAVTAYVTAFAIKGHFPFLKPYQEVRLRAFFSKILPSSQQDTEERLTDSLMQATEWAPLQSRIAIGSGRLWGRGWCRGTQVRLGFLPQPHTDYIFASCGEQFGLVGCALVLAFYGLLIYRSIFAALHAKDWFGYLLIVGVLTVLITHIILNVGVAVDILPVTGLPLPLLSYGGSFLITMYVGLALVTSVGMRRDVF